MFGECITWRPRLVCEELLACIIYFHDATAPVRSYIRTTQRSSSDIDSSLLPYVLKASVTSENTFHISHAFSFPLPAKDDTVSQPVKAWRTSWVHGGNQFVNYPKLTRIYLPERSYCTYGHLLDPLLHSISHIRTMRVSAGAFSCEHEVRMVTLDSGGSRRHQLHMLHYLAIRSWKTYCL